VAEKFYNSGQNGDDDDGENDQRKILFYERNISEIISAENKKSGPSDAADNVVADKAPIAHLADAGDKRRESSDNRNEPGNDNSFSSVLFIKLARFFQIFFIQKTDVFFGENFWAGKMAYPIIYSIA